MRDVSRRCVDALLASAADGSSDVREQIISSLRAMAAKDVLAILSQCQQWLATRKHGSTPHLQRLMVVQSIREILKNHVSTSTLPNNLRDELVATAFSEMTSITDLNSEWAKESCALMVDMCDLHPRQGCGALIDPIQSTTLPHFFVMQALCDFATVSPLRFLPFLKETMAKILPILGLAKQDNHRMVFANALGAFSDAVLQMANRNEDLTPRSQESGTLKREDFADSMYSAMNFLAGDWSRVSEQRVRGPVMYAIGTASAIIGDENRVQLLTKIVPMVINGMKKEKPRDQAPVSAGFAALFLHVSDEVLTGLQPHMETLLPLLVQSIQQTNADKDATTNAAVKKNMGRLFDAAENVAVFYMDGLLTFISKTLDAKSGSKDAAARAACLTMLKHIISRKSLEDRTEPYKDTIIATVKLAISDADWRVRKAIVSCVVSMGASGTKYFKAIGGTDLLTYVIKNSAIPDNVVNDFNEAAKKKDPCLGTSPEDIRDTCRNTLALFTATSSKLDNSLWPFLLEHFNDHVQQPELLLSLPCICRCLVALGGRMMETDKYYIDFNVKVNVPRPGHLAAKLLVQAMQFGHYDSDELNSILEAMTVIAPLIDDPLASEAEEPPTPIGTLWLATVPELQEYVASPDANAEEWEEIMCKFVSKTITSKQTETWVEEITAAALVHLEGYRNPSMFRSAQVLIGVGVGRCSKREFIAESIESLVNTANHDDKNHRMGLAKAMGYIAAHHPDAALEKLALLSKGPEKKGFFGGSKDKTKKELIEPSRAIAAYGLCFASRRLPQSILQSRLDASVLPLLSTILTETKVLEVRESTMDAAILLEQALRKQGEGFTFKSRDSFIETLLNVVPIAPNPKVPANEALLKTATMAMRSVASLVNAVATPALSGTTVDKVSQFVLHYVQRGWPEMPAEVETAAQQAAAEIMVAVFNNSVNFDLDTILTPLHALTVTSRDLDRRRSMSLYVKMIQACAKRMERTVSAGETVTGAVITPGSFLGRLVPRFMDTVPEIRKIAADGVMGTVRIVAMLLPDMIAESEMDVDGTLVDLKALRGRAVQLVKDGTQASEKEAASITKLLCGAIVTLLPRQEHFSPLLETLLVSGLTDPQDDAASCSCVVMHGMIRGLGGSLPEANAKKSLEDLVDAVEKVQHREQSLNGILVSIRNLAKHHPMMVFNRMLKYETPHQPNVVKAFQAVAGDSSLAKNFILHSLDTILNSQLIEDRQDEKDKRKLVKDLAQPPLSAACGLGWMCQGSQKAIDAATNLRGSVYATLFLYLTATHEFGNITKATLVACALQLVISATASELTVDRLEKYGWPTFLHPENFQLAIQETIKYVCHEELGDEGEGDRDMTIDPIKGLPLPPSEPSPLMIEMGEFILPYANKPIRSHRRAAINAAGMLLRHSIGEPRMVQSINTALLGRSGTDEDADLRGEALMGFAGLTDHPYADISAFVSPVLSALLTNFSDAVGQVAFAAMVTAHHLMENLADKSQISPIIVNIILKVKALFEAPDPLLRGKAYEIFGYILHMANEGFLDDQTMEQQSHLHLVTLLMHVEDDDINVRQAAKGALIECTKFIANHAAEDARARIDAIFSKAHMEPENKTKYDEFANEFAYMWVLDFPGRVNDLLVSNMTFMQVPQEPLRGAAVTMCGYVLKHLPSEDFNRANVDQVCGALIQSINPSREKSAMVRTKAARAIGLLREI